jgi:hypothetical protein
MEDRMMRAVSRLREPYSDLGMAGLRQSSSTRSAPRRRGSKLRKVSEVLERSPQVEAPPSPSKLLDPQALLQKSTIPLPPLAAAAIPYRQVSGGKEMADCCGFPLQGSSSSSNCDSDYIPPLEMRRGGESSCRAAGDLMDFTLEELRAAMALSQLAHRTMEMARLLKGWQFDAHLFGFVNLPPQ